MPSLRDTVGCLYGDMDIIFGICHTREDILAVLSLKYDGLVLTLYGIGYRVSAG